MKPLSPAGEVAAEPFAIIAELRHQLAEVSARASKLEHSHERLKAAYEALEASVPWAKATGADQEYDGIKARFHFTEAALTKMSADYEHMRQQLTANEIRNDAMSTSLQALQTEQVKLLEQVEQARTERDAERAARLKLAENNAELRALIIRSRQFISGTSTPGSPLSPASTLPISPLLSASPGGEVSGRGLDSGRSARSSVSLSAIRQAAREEEKGFGPDSTQ
jgi:hypothetical protein